ncbi:uncharacterized protein GcM1_250253 [Golovinomyces cichoracearum]|uniref:YMC020W-like alpha/beta hydrolase domain-containing protein n=1 Tax=Golovinomyces cichoracearum TaxID=62708 RepID=A0A420IBG1_9PEZI|nr:uncharacterized protein GcM1_250253 [Golovinomyces cichoracearum]
MLGSMTSNNPENNNFDVVGSTLTKSILNGVYSSEYSSRECLTSQLTAEKSPKLKESSTCPNHYGWLGGILTKPKLLLSKVLAERATVDLVGPSNDKIVHNSSSTNSYPTRLIKSLMGSTWTFCSSNSKATHITPNTIKLISPASNSKNKPIQSSNKVPDKIAKNLKNEMNSKENESKKLQVGHLSEQAPPNTDTKEISTTRDQNPCNDSPPNLLLPSLSNTYQTCEIPSTFEKISRFMNLGHQKTQKHLCLSRETYKLRKAVVIGVHGLVPVPLLRAVTGQPTGTSVRFVNRTADAIQRWADSHNIENCDIQKIPLEGGGKVTERVENLWKILLNWITHIQKADVIMFACHSQGVPVAVILTAKLIEFGVVSKARIGVCAMAGVSLGPFIEFKSRLIGGSAGELFEFADSESEISNRYEKALRDLVTFGGRILFCGSIDDQLISMESSLFLTASHPYIYRAAFIDGRIYAPNFLSHLIGFALKLRNIGISDHGLIRELALPLAGSLYSGEGHSRLHDDSQVYDLAVQFALETTSVGYVPLEVKKHKIPKSSNPYLLPWIMRGFLEEEYVRTELKLETIELLKSFESWKPTTKSLKDIKYRLEAIKSKL